jgi:hypothetical protein
MSDEFFSIEYNNDGTIKRMGATNGVNNPKGKVFYYHKDWLLFNRIMTLEINIINEKNVEESKKELSELRVKVKKAIKIATIYKLEDNNINKLKINEKI